MPHSGFENSERVKPADGWRRAAAERVAKERGSNRPTGGGFVPRRRIVGRISVLQVERQRQRSIAKSWRAKQKRQNAAQAEKEQSAQSNRSSTQRKFKSARPAKLPRSHINDSVNVQLQQRNPKKSKPNR